MNSMHWHKQFAKALTAPDLPPPDSVIRHDGKSDLKRFNEYLNNHVMSLITNLKDGFPVVAALVGDDFFLAIWRAYILNTRRLNHLSWYFTGKAFLILFVSFHPQGNCHIWPILPSLNISSGYRFMPVTRHILMLITCHMMPRHYYWRNFICILRFI